jgi:DNA-binding GntR family transcriptional regulator
MEETIVRSGEDVYERLRSDIIFGRLQPNEPLRLERLRKSYGVSVGTLREALCRLTPGGLVTAEDQRGFQVAPCSLDGLREVAELRLLLEEHALTQSFALGDMEWEGQVVAAHYKLAKIEQQLITGDEVSLELWKRYDFEFHRALVSACGSHAMLEIHAGVYDRYLRYQMVFGVFRGAIAADEHRELIDAALKRNASQAIAILEKHIRSCVDFIVSRNGRTGLTGRTAR